jgi:hypothetical protein
MADQLTTYNLALVHLGERKLAALTENREPRRVLDDAWTTIPQYCIAQGMWYFGMRTSGALVQVAGDLGYAHGYTKPSDLIHVFSIGDNVGFNPQSISDYLDHGNTIYSNAAQLFMRYLSNDATNGAMNLTNWSPSFTRYVAAALARYTCVRITGNVGLKATIQEEEDSLYLSTFSMDSLGLLRGLLPFNAEARNPSGSDPIQGAANLLPFSGYFGAMARMGMRAQGGGAPPAR